MDFTDFFPCRNHYVQHRWKYHLCIIRVILQSVQSVIQTLHGAQWRKPLNHRFTRMYGFHWFLMSDNRSQNNVLLIYASRFLRSRVTRLISSLTLRPGRLLALHRQGLLLSSFRLLSHLRETSNITMWANRQFPQPDFHWQDTQPYGLRTDLHGCMDLTDFCRAEIIASNTDENTTFV